MKRIIISALLLFMPGFAMGMNGGEFVVAARMNREPLVRQFLDDGGDVDACEGDGVTALHTAAYWEHHAIINLLLAHGANVNRTNNFGWTALHFAVDGRHIEVVRSLCQRSDIRPSLNTVDILRGETPHSMAVRTDQTDMAQIIKDATQWSLIKGIPTGQ